VGVELDVGALRIAVLGINLKPTPLDDDDDVDVAGLM
jgi:hypothetical protein